MLKTLSMAKVGYRYYKNGRNYTLRIESTFSGDSFIGKLVLLPKQGYAIPRTVTPCQWHVRGDTIEEVVETVDEFLYGKLED